MRLVFILASLTTVLLLATPAAAQRDTVRVRLGSGAGDTEAWVVYPAGKAPGPAVVVVHEWWGLNGQIREVARRLAAQGYVAIVPDLYRGKVTDDPERAHVLRRGLDDARVLADLDAAIAWLRADPRVGPKGRIGIIGFCMGGTHALREAIHRPDLRAAVTFYGAPETGQVAKLAVPLQAHFGAADEGLPRASVDAFKAALAGAGKKADVYVYASAGHAFLNEERPSYHADAARQAWTRTLAHLQKHLKS